MPLQGANPSDLMGLRRNLPYIINRPNGWPITIFGRVLRPHTTSQAQISMPTRTPALTLDNQTQWATPLDFPPHLTTLNSKSYYLNRASAYMQLPCPPASATGQIAPPFGHPTAQRHPSPRPSPKLYPYLLRDARSECSPLTFPNYQTHVIGAAVGAAPSRCDARPTRLSRAQGGGGRCLALLLLLGGVSYVPAQTVFNDRASLLTARSAWCADPAAARATYGEIGTWDVSRVSDMSYLFCATSRSFYLLAGCDPACITFDDDSNGWDTASVTKMNVCQPPAPAPTHH